LLLLLPFYFRVAILLSYVPIVVGYAEGSCHFTVVTSFFLFSCCHSVRCLLEEHLQEAEVGVLQLSLRLSLPLCLPLRLLVLYGFTRRVRVVAGPLALFVLRWSLVTSWVWLFLIAAPAIFLCCYQLAYADLIAGVVSQLITVPISRTG